MVIDNIWKYQCSKYSKNAQQVVWSLNNEFHVIVLSDRYNALEYVLE